MFGPDSGNNGWHGLNLVYEGTHIGRFIFDPNNKRFHQKTDTYADSSHDEDTYFIKLVPNLFDRIHEKS